MFSENALMTLFTVVEALESMFTFWLPPWPNDEKNEEAALLKGWTCVDEELKLVEELLREELELLLEDEGTLLETNEAEALLNGRTCVEDELELRLDELAHAPSVSPCWA